MICCEKGLAKEFPFEEAVGGGKTQGVGGIEARPIRDGRGQNSGLGLVLNFEFKKYEATLDNEEALRVLDYVERFLESENAQGTSKKEIGGCFIVSKEFVFGLVPDNMNEPYQRGLSVEMKFGNRVDSGFMSLFCAESFKEHLVEILK